MCTYPVQPICTFSCTSVFFINIYYPQYTVLHILSHCISYSFYFIICPFSFSPIFIYIFSCVMFHCFIAYVIFIIIFFLHFPLSGPVLTYISLLIIPCMIVYVTNIKNLDFLGKQLNWLKILMYMIKDVLNVPKISVTNFRQKSKLRFCLCMAE